MDEASEVLLQDAVDDLGLAIGLEMIGGAQPQLRAT